MRPSGTTQYLDSGDERLGINFDRRNMVDLSLFVAKKRPKNEKKWSKGRINLHSESSDIIFAALL